MRRLLYDASTWRGRLLDRLLDAMEMLKAQEDLSPGFTESFLIECPRVAGEIFKIRKGFELLEDHQRRDDPNIAEPISLILLGFSGFLSKAFIPLIVQMGKRDYAMREVAGGRAAVDRLTGNIVSNGGPHLVYTADGPRLIGRIDDDPVA